MMTKMRGQMVAARSTAVLPLEALTLIPLLGALVGLVRHHDADEEAGLNTAELLVLIGAIVVVVVAVVAIIAVKLKGKSNNIDLGS